MEMMEMKKREQCAVGNERKTKSLQQRWFRVDKRTPGSESTVESAETDIDRGTVVTLAGTDGSLADYVVMGIYNKWFLVDQSKNKAVQLGDSSAVRLHVRKVKYDDTVDLHVKLTADGSNHKDVHKQIELSEVKSIKGRLSAFD